MKSFKLVAASIGTAAAMFAAGASAQSGVLLPITITNASGNVADMAKAADGNPNTIWNAGGGATQWIDIDLGSERMFLSIRMLPAQSPAGQTIHHIWGRNDAGKWFDFGEISSSTQDNQWIEYQNLKEIPVRTIIVETKKSPSWVAWREFQVYDGGDLFKSCHLNHPSGVIVYRTGGGGCSDYQTNTTFYMRDTRSLPKGAVVYTCSTYGMYGWTWINTTGTLPYAGTTPRDGRCGAFQYDELFRMRKN
ncbi:discoidin domain-containing protein [Delftia tsuruhatensis]|uniref:discoidin domain-containing protein n=1 Tax=Delftia tsuruhatensis TaxID=180282 RepID=UPI0009BC06D6|nr:discoidin domain-containing protein [Delftia tsuruhatensis]MDH2234432.1 discoidin domain-containing protein [Delftia tsuruhatensis]